MEQSPEAHRIRTAFANLDSNPKNREKWSCDNLGNQMTMDERRNTLETLLREHGYLPLGEKRILDVGCGSGGEFTSLEKLGALPENFFGVDLSEARVAASRLQYPKSTFHCCNAEHLDFPDESFDLILFCTVFSSILSDVTAENVAREAKRLLKRGGSIVWYDFRYPSPTNPNTRPMPRRKFEKLYDGFHVDARKITVLPPLARRLGRANALLYRALGRIPLLNSHYMALLTKP